MPKIEFPEEIKNHILSYLPVTPRFKFDTYKQCILHEILYNFMNGPKPSPSKIYITCKVIGEFQFYLHNYYLKDNNYLQNENGDTPLHIAYFYKNRWAISLLQTITPEMKYICNNNGLLPSSMSNYNDIMLQEIDYPQEMTNPNASYIVRY
tara:strand:+ start:172 stop:624 length:453 start_codon:yes stop_codon:yes gene_type:complete